MDVVDQEFEDQPRAPQQLILDLDGFEGPLDLLLTLAREQKVDIKRLSMLQLADQYLEFIARAQRIRLELAADYLVMAAWLAYLKSRLLLPQTDDDEEPSGAEMAAALRFQLQRLEAMRKAGETIFERPQLGSEFHARGMPEPVRVSSTDVFEGTLFELLAAYGAIQARGKVTTLEIRESAQLFAVEAARKRLEGALGAVPEWRTLMSFLPDGLNEGLNWRSAVASTFAASLDLAKSGKAEIRQDSSFGPIYVRRRERDGADSSPGGADQ
jgi:segregation and condensation protein A